MFDIVCWAHVIFVGVRIVPQVHHVGTLCAEPVFADGALDYFVDGSVTFLYLRTSLFLFDWEAV